MQIDYTPEQKAAILRRHIAEKVPVSDLCDEMGIQPSVFYTWQRQLFENLSAALEDGRRNRRGETTELERERKRVETLESKLVRKNEVIAEISRDLRERCMSDCSNADRYTDLMKAGGEDNSARLVAAALRARGLAAEYVCPVEAGLLLEGAHGEATVVPDSYDSLRKLCGRDHVVVFPGFFGGTADGSIMTFPRGGSDITGAIIAAAVRADVYENFTDVDSVFAANTAAVGRRRRVGSHREKSRFSPLAVRQDLDRVVRQSGQTPQRPGQADPSSCDTSSNRFPL